MQILVRTVHTVQQTVDFHRYNSWDGCHAPVVVQRQVPWSGRAENCGVPQLQCLWPLSSFWTRLLCPSVQRLWAAQYWFDYGYMFCIIQGGFWKNLYNFLHEGVDWILRSILVASLLAHIPKSAALVVDYGSGMLFGGFYWYFCTSRCDPDVCRHDGMHTVRSVHSRCFSCSRAALGKLYIISLSLLYFQHSPQSIFCASRFFWGLEHSQL